MTTLRTVIVDDEALARRLMRSILERIANIEVIAECKNGREAIDRIPELMPDLVFLDIQMPGLSGFDVVRRLQADIMPMIVFATAHEEFAIDAFDVHAVDYLLKPIDDDRVLRAVLRANARFEDGAYTREKPKLIGAIGDIAAKVAQVQQEDLGEQQTVPASSSTLDHKIAIRDKDMINMINATDIDWVDAAGDYMCIHSNGETHILRSTMKQLLAELDPEVFKRIHRSTIVNLNRIQHVIPHTKGEYFLDLGNQERIKVSRHYRDAIKNYVTNS